MAFVEEGRDAAKTGGSDDAEVCFFIFFNKLNVCFLLLVLIAYVVKLFSPLNSSLFLVCRAELDFDLD